MGGPSQENPAGSWWDRIFDLRWLVERGSCQVAIVDRVFAPKFQRAEYDKSDG